MKQETLLQILQQAGKLKTTYRHCYTEEGRKESVADHSWRIALFAMLLSNEEEFADIDMAKVIRMCLIHDLGESFTGDIPSFYKTDSDVEVEDATFDKWVDSFPEPDRIQWIELLAEMNALETREAKLYKSLDKLEAVIAHNESDLSTWLPLEYDLQLTYGKENVQFSDYMKELKANIDNWTLTKIGK